MNAYTLLTLKVNVKNGRLNAVTAYQLNDLTT
jgi:hypothetical protein